MKVREALKKDCPRLLELLKQVNKVHVDIRPDLFCLTTKYNKEELEKNIKDPNTPIFVCVDDDDRVMGYGMCQLKDYSDVEVRTNIKSVYIDDICVDEVYRRQGVARSIYDYICNFAKIKSCYNVTLNVWEGNDAARRFYDSLGMKPKKTTLEHIL